MDQSTRVGYYFSLSLAVNALLKTLTQLKLIRYITNIRS